MRQVQSKLYIFISSSSYQQKYMDNKITCCCFCFVPILIGLQYDQLENNLNIGRIWSLISINQELFTTTYDSIHTRYLNMSKKLQKSQNNKKSSKKETNSVNSNGSKNILVPSSSDMHSQDVAKNYKIEQISEKDKAALQNVYNDGNGGRLQNFDSGILSQFQLQKIDDMVLSKDEKMLYIVTFLGKKDPTIERKCVCTSGDMALIQERCHRQYRSQHLELYLTNNIQ